MVRIDVSAFDSCRNLTEIDLSENLEYIGYEAFSQTGYSYDADNWESSHRVSSSAGSWDVPLALYIDGYLIEASPHTAEFTVKEGTIGIAARAFYDKTIQFDESCTIYLNSDLQYISDGAFRYSEDNKNIDYVVFTGDAEQRDNVKVDLANNYWLKKLSFNIDGDVDRDGDFTSSDILALRQAIAMIRDINELDFRHADTNGDGKINAKDMLALKLKIAE